MCCESEPGQNLERAKALIREAQLKGANIVCLPELFLTPYFCQTEDETNFDLAEPIPGPTSAIMSELAAELGIVLIVPVFEKRAPGLYHNSTIIIDADGALLGTYRKMHIPDDPGFQEKYYFTPGDLGFRAWETRYGKIGVCICWDQWFPEAARLTALEGAEILFFPTAIGWHPAEKETLGATQHESWQLVQRSHGVTNGCFIAAANRAGLESSPRGEIEFWGQSFISAPDGSLLDELGPTDEGVIVVEAPGESIEVHRTQWPFLRDRRVDAYQGISRLHSSE